MTEILENVKVFAPLHRGQGYDNTSTFSSKTAKLKMKRAEFANSIVPNEAAHYELPHLDLLCLPLSL